MPDSKPADFYQQSSSYFKLTEVIGASFLGLLSLVLLFALLRSEARYRRLLLELHH